MKATACLLAAGSILVLGPIVSTPLAQSAAPAGFVSIFNGKDLTGWKIPDGDNGHWKVVDGVIDYDAGSEAEKDKNLWTEKAYKNFVARVDWRIKATPVHQQEHADRDAGRPRQARREREGDQHRRAGFRLGIHPARLRQGPAQHLVLAGRVG